MHIWLKKNAEERLESLKQQGLFGEDLRVEIHRATGKKYLSIYEELDPLPDIIPEEIVEHVTMKDRIYKHFRPEGVYRHKGAEIRVKTEVRIYSEIEATTIEREEYQEFFASGPSVKAVKTIYTLVRQGKLQPEENWESKLLGTEPETAAPELTPTEA